MRNFKKSNNLKNFLESLPVLTVLFVVLLFFAWGVWGLLGKLEVTGENKKFAEDRLAELARKKESLTYEIDQLKTREGQEASIREKFGLAKEGEGLIVVVDDKNAAPESKAKSGIIDIIKNWFR